MLWPITATREKTARQLPVPLMRREQDRPSLGRKRRVQIDHVDARDAGLREGSGTGPHRAGIGQVDLSAHLMLHRFTRADVVHVHSNGLLAEVAVLLGDDLITATDSDLTTQHDGEPQGQRIIVTGQVLDSGGRPVPDTLIEIWQTNAGGRYRHSREHHPAPLDPNFDGIGRAIPDALFLRFEAVAAFDHASRIGAVESSGGAHAQGENAVEEVKETLSAHGLTLRGDEVFGHRITISYFRAQTDEEVSPKCRNEDSLPTSPN